MKNVVHAIFSRLGRIRKSTLVKITFILTGIVSTIWFLVRVIPKPQRAAYPCMRVAAPIMSGFVIWLVSLAGSVAAFRKARLSFMKSRYLYGTLFLIIGLAGSLFIASRHDGISSPKSTAEWIITPNQPVGIARGINPGRVVWIHDPAVARWDGATGNWWDENVVSQQETDKMVKESLTSLTGEKNEKKAWTALFRHFNSTHNRKDLNYKQGQKIAVKINTNNTYSHQDSPEINATPQLVLSLLKSLIEGAGIAQENITVYDASRIITDNIFKKCNDVYPGVIFVDNVGGDG